MTDRDKPLPPLEKGHAVPPAPKPRRRLDPKVGRIKRLVDSAEHMDSVLVETWEVSNYTAHAKARGWLWRTKREGTKLGSYLGEARQLPAMRVWFIDPTQPTP